MATYRVWMSWMVIQDGYTIVEADSAEAAREAVLDDPQQTIDEIVEADQIEDDCIGYEHVQVGEIDQVKTDGNGAVIKVIETRESAGA